MQKRYYYFPILKTRTSEVNAYEALDFSVKSEILPIIEMTGELGYTYSSKCKDEKMRGKRRPGDINKKVQKILNFMENRRFVLDITDDEALKYDGLSNRNGGLLDPADGYRAWCNFLRQNTTFKKQVIPTIQFDTTYMSEVEKQIEELDKEFDYLAIKLPAHTNSTDSLEPNPIPQIIDYVYAKLSNNNAKLLIILDYAYVSDFDEKTVQYGLSNIDTAKLKALIVVSSSFPASVRNAGKPPLPIHENDISDVAINTLQKNNVFHGDYSSIHPIRYEMGGGGWIPRIDYIIRDSTGRAIKYAYFRGNKANTSSEYTGLAQQVIAAPNYVPITKLSVIGDQRIAAKARNGAEGKSPSYWITVRSNIYMTTQYLYLKAHGLFLSL